MTATIDMRTEDDGWQVLPGYEDMARRAVAAALAAAGHPPGKTALSVLFSGDAQVAYLNNVWRGIARPTNVLSFPAPQTPGSGGEGRVFIGDIVLALATLRREAHVACKPLATHLCHLVVHGTLHLIGHTHETDADAGQMEHIEAAALAAMGLPEPYQDGAARPGQPLTSAL